MSITDGLIVFMGGMYLGVFVLLITVAWIEAYGLISTVQGLRSLSQSDRLASTNQPKGNGHALDKG